MKQHHLFPLFYILLTLFMTSCVYTQKTLNTEEKLKQNTWKWDDVKQSWMYNGFSYSSLPKGSLWKAEEKAITLQIGSDKSLNSFNNAANGLRIKIFQLTNSKAFLQATQSIEGLIKLLTSNIDEPSYLSSQSFIILPGTQQKFVLDREKNSRYIAIVTGYTNPKPAEVFRLIPIVDIYKPTPTPIKKTDSLLSFSLLDTKSEKQPSLIPERPAHLNLDLSLGALGIEKLEIQAK